MKKKKYTPSALEKVGDVGVTILVTNIIVTMNLLLVFVLVTAIKAMVRHGSL